MALAEAGDGNLTRDGAEGQFHLVVDHLGGDLHRDPLAAGADVFNFDTVCYGV